jgi:hypothetical protein
MKHKHKWGLWNLRPFSNVYQRLCSCRAKQLGVMKVRKYGKRSYQYCGQIKEIKFGTKEMQSL